MLGANIFNCSKYASFYGKKDFLVGEVNIIKPI